MNKTQVKKVLRECAFDPNAHGPLRIISDVGNVDYYIKRAKEELSQETPDLQFAIRLLVLASK